MSSIFLFLLGIFARVELEYLKFTYTAKHLRLCPFLNLKVKMKKRLTIFTLFLCMTQIYAQKNVYFNTSGIKSITIKLDDDPGEFPFDEIPNPYAMGLPKNSKLDFILPSDSLQVILKEYLVVNISREDKSDTIRLLFNPVEIVTFDHVFKQKYDGKINVDIPEVYELVNIMIAISPTGIADKDLIYTNSDYYNKVISHFSKYKKDNAVITIDSLLKKDNYYNLKMDSYAFVFSKSGKIVPHPNYHVINWSNVNSITPTLLGEINEFAKKSGFRKFYQANKKSYDIQKKFYQNKVNFSQMVTWLNKNFPSTRYNFLNVLFSPLVYGNQSTRNFEDNDFKEAQLHVNFPYYNKTVEKGIEKSYHLYRGNILFTELNHNFINPEADKYASQIKAILSDLSKWQEAGKAAQFGYPSAMACFNEYMNWGLVTLYLSDYANPKDMPNIITKLNDFMTNYRGFSKFNIFSDYLLNIYKNRKSHTTIADLYPQIINWFEENN